MRFVRAQYGRVSNLSLLNIESSTKSLPRSQYRAVGSPLDHRPNITELRSLPIVRPQHGQKVPPIKTQARSATILPNFVGLKFQIHNGKRYDDITITEDMVGHKLGEFAPYVT